MNKRGQFGNGQGMRIANRAKERKLRENALVLAVETVRQLCARAGRHEVEFDKFVMDESIPLRHESDQFVALCSRVDVSSQPN